MFWLAWRQSRTVLLTLLVAVPCLIAILFDLPVGVWGPCTLLLGIVGGIGSLNSEQTSNTFRFLGDRRIPIGRFWLMKSLYWFVAAALLPTLFVSLLFLLAVSGATDLLQSFER